MLNNITQQSFCNGDSYQAGRDFTQNTTNNYITIEINDLYFYEDDIKEVITFFNDNITTFTDEPFPDNKPIEISEKNILNSLSEEYFTQISDNYLPLFGKIRSFFLNSENEDYVTMYNSTANELNPLSLTLLKSVKSFDNVFILLYDHILKNCKTDRKFMKIRTKVLLFLHFMYYNCDIGIK